MVSNLKLHLGCFDQPLKGWINSDITPHLWITRVPGLAALLYRAGRINLGRFEQHKEGIFKKVVYLNVTKRFPYNSGTLDAVFSSHLLEHLYRNQAEFCLGEIHRVLKPDAVCRIVVPDLDKIIANYNRELPELSLKKIFECDGLEKNVHHWHYNARSLSTALKAKGFREICQCAPQEGKCPDLQLLDNRPDESLFMEAIK